MCARHDPLDYSPFASGKPIPQSIFEVRDCRKGAVREAAKFLLPRATTPKVTSSKTQSSTKRARISSGSLDDQAVAQSSLRCCGRRFVFYSG
jgi:hypothetical protein